VSLIRFASFKELTIIVILTKLNIYRDLLDKFLYCWVSDIINIPTSAPDVTTLCCFLWCFYVYGALEISLLLLLLFFVLRIIDPKG